MESPDKYQMINPERDEPKAILTLADCTLELNRSGPFIVMRFIQNGLGYVIDVPWDEADFRMMVAGWLSRLGTGENGQGTSSN